MDLHAKHFTGLAFFFSGLLQKGQVKSDIVVLPELLKLFWRTDLLKAVMS